MKKSLTIMTLSTLLASYSNTPSRCEKDKKNLCSEKTKHHNETNENCLQENIDKILEKSCKESLNDARPVWLEKKKSFTNLKASCVEFVEKKCPESASTRKDFKVCIMMHEDEVNEACKTAFNHHVNKYLPGISTLK